MAEKQRILVIDDTLSNIKTLNALLKDTYSISMATNGKDALEIANSENRPDLVLLDVMMPDMDGYQVCSQLKSGLLTKDIPIIFLTSATKSEEVAKGFEIGAVDYVTKPFNPSELRARIKTHLDLRSTFLELHKSKGEIHNLLNLTLTATIRTLIDFVSLKNPLLYSRSMRLGKYATALCKYLKLDNLWEFEIAATLSQIGLAFLPSQLIDKICIGKELTEAETIEMDSAIKTGGELLRRIPNTTDVAEMIVGFKDVFIENHFRSDDILNENKLEIGKRLLRLIIALDDHLIQENSFEDTINYLKQHKTLYDDFLINGLKHSIKVSESEIVCKRINVTELIVGMVLDENLYNTEQVLLLKRNTEISGSILNKIEPLIESEKVTGTIQVLDRRLK